VHARALRFLARGVAAGALLFVLAFAVQILTVLRPPSNDGGDPLVVNDITQLNPIRVSEAIAPTTAAEIASAVKSHAGPISIGGARHSMGGQIATPDSLHIDMRRFNRTLDFSPATKTITVQAGTRWRQIQERIDSSDLSVKIMQTYANFTVGGSLSVNVHGRYVGLGPIIFSVRSFKIILADGSEVEASPTRHADIFYGAIGGYGGLGVMTDVTLELADNVRVKRHAETMPIDRYREYFVRSVRGAPSALFHNADIYATDYSDMHAVTYSITTEPATIADRLIPDTDSYRLNRLVYWAISDWPFGVGIRRHLVDPILFRGEPVTWRNYEASYDAAELEPSTRASATYVLEEYFVPVERFDAFVPRMRAILRGSRANIINISVRHARADPGSLLAWARSDVFAFVIYYKQRTDAAARAEVGVWTRALIDAALDAGGSYYLPYQLHATASQFRRAYPRFDEFVALKRRVDPTNKFRNALWDTYYPR
jgi:FAD/FMN-containing dehydrogenase